MSKKTKGKFENNVYQTENIDKEVNIVFFKKESNKNSVVEKYYNGNENTQGALKQS